MIVRFFKFPALLWHADEYGWPDEERKTLDKALEAFAEQVPYENQPDDIQACDEENN